MYIRERKEYKTGYQDHFALDPLWDLQQDWVMIWGIDTFLKHADSYREKGYRVNLMYAPTWGAWEYMSGKWDGKDHKEEEAVTLRDGSKMGVAGGGENAYLVPTINYEKYLAERLRPVVDAGAEGIFFEEPDFSDLGGYSEAFKREWEAYYNEPWQPPHSSLDARYKSGKLKDYLLTRMYQNVSADLKEYARTKHNRELKMYCASHSLLNCVHLKSVCTSGSLVDIPDIDGFIAQVWTGTARFGCIFEGISRERVFENNYLEYGIAKELVKCSDRKMWFLQDPIEDDHSYTWEHYRYDYLQTLTASLLHPEVSDYEICPWPDRVFGEGLLQPQQGCENYRIYMGRTPLSEAVKAGVQPELLPQSYRTLLSSMFQMLGDMDQEDVAYEGVPNRVGYFMANNGLYQMRYPDGITNKSIQERLRALRHGDDVPFDQMDFEGSKALMEDIAADQDYFFDYIQRHPYPNMFGPTLPLLKYGLPVQPVLLENVRRYENYLNEYDNLILSYEHIKPENEGVNQSIVKWVKEGGTLFYIGDGSDPYHAIESWWKEAGYETPAEHLFEEMDLSRTPEDGVYTVGRGKLCVWNIAPARLCLTKEIAQQYRSWVKENLKGEKWEYTNNMTLRRGPYIISVSMAESTGKTKEFRGLYADMYENDYRIITEKKVGPDQNAILFDFAKIEGEEVRIVGTSARIFRLDVEETKAEFTAKAADKVKVFTRLRLPKPVTSCTAVDETGEKVDMTWSWDDATQTALFGYESTNQEVNVTVKF